MYPSPNTYSAYAELLSFASIDDAVDLLFRAYLDAKLVGFWQDQIEKGVDYLSAVESFRRINLDPFTLRGNNRVLEEVDRAKAEELFTTDPDKKFKHAQGYLYWFDIRADYWIQNPLQKKFYGLVVPSKVLYALEKYASELKSRSEEAVKYKEVEGEEPRDLFVPSADVTALSISLLKTIVAATPTGDTTPTAGTN